MIIPSLRLTVEPSAYDPKRIEKVGSEALRVEWADGHQSVYRWASLRAACPCAVCREMKQPVPSESRPVEIQPVGRYAMSIRWDDGHTTGIFSFDYLRSLCDCEACRPTQMDEG